MSISVSIDGTISGRDDAKVSVFDRGFLYGDSAFEVMRTYHGTPFAEREHLLRLEASCKRILIPFPGTIEMFREEIAATLKSAANNESYVRVVVTRGQGPLNYDPTTATTPTRVIIVTPLAKQPKEIYSDGVTVSCLHASRPTDDPRAKGVKASNYLANLLAVHEARQRGAYEAILLAPGGQVLEGASSNVFVVKDGHVRTPPLSASILAGITRQTVFDAAARVGVRLQESTMFPGDLYGADEAFITSTLRELVPVVNVDGKTVGSGSPGPVTAKLHKAFREVVAGAKS